MVNGTVILIFASTNEIMFKMSFSAISETFYMYFTAKI